jgi:hypothetical protein
VQSCSHGSVVVEVLGWLSLSPLFLIFRLFLTRQKKTPDVVTTSDRLSVSL